MRIVVTERGVRFKAKTVEKFMDEYRYLPDEIKDKFQDGDEIWYFSDFGISSKWCEREAILLVRNGKFVETHLIAMS